MRLRPGTMVLAAAIAVVLLRAPLGLSWWGRFAAFVTMPAWLGPIVVRFSHTQPRAADFTILSADDPSVPAAARAAFESTRTALAGYGFSEVVRLRQVNPTPGLLGYVQLLENERTFDVCSRLIAAHAGARLLASDVCVFVAERDVGSALATSNTRHVSPWPDNPAFDRAIFSDVREPVKLLALHRARPAIEPSRHIRRTTVASDPPAYQSRIERVAKEHMVRCGYWWLDESARVYRPTWKGAALMCWRLLPPVKQILQWRRNRAATALRQRLDRTGFVASA
jgi:hypothetical protein